MTADCNLLPGEATEMRVADRKRKMGDL